MNRINLNSLRRLVTYSQTKPLHEANKCVLFMNGSLAKPEVNLQEFFLNWQSTELQCGAAGAMISILEVENVDFREVDIVDVTDSNENQESVPQIYFNGKSFGGYDELFEAYQNDELRFILLNAGLTLPEKTYL